MTPPTYEFDEFTAVRCDGSSNFSSIQVLSDNHGMGTRAQVSHLGSGTRQAWSSIGWNTPLNRRKQKMREVQLPPYLIERLAHGRLIQNSDLYDLNHVGIRDEFHVSGRFSKFTSNRCSARQQRLLRDVVILVERSPGWASRRSRRTPSSLPP